jgi:hypothetical protein
MALSILYKVPPVISCMFSTDVVYNLLFFKDFFFQQILVEKKLAFFVYFVIQIFFAELFWAF